MGQQLPEVTEPTPKEEPGIFSQITGIPKEFVKGAASGLVQAAGGLGALPYAAARYVAPDIKPFEETAFGRTITQAEKALAPSDEGYITQLAGGLGSFASIFGPQALLRGVGGAGRLATGIAPKAATPFALGQTSGLGIEEARQRAAIERAEGTAPTPGEELAALALGAPIGLTELLPVERLFKGLDTGLSEGFKFNVANLVKRGLQQGGIEGAQEVASGLMQDLAAKGIYNPELELGKSMFDELTVGGGVGAISQVGLDILFKGRIKDAYQASQRKKAEEEIRKKADELIQAQQKQIATTKEQLGIKEGEMLALPAPAKEVAVEEKVDPLQNPLGMFKPDQLQEGYLQAVNKMRDDQGMAKVKSLSIEDIADAGAPQVEIDRLIAGRLAEQGVDVAQGLELGLTRKDIENIAAQKNIDTGTPGFTDFLRRTTGVDADESMSPMQRLAAFEALSKIERSDEKQVLPEGTNATRFTQDQYDKSIKSIKDLFPETGRLGRSQVIKEIKDYSGLENDRDAESLLQAAIRNGDFATESTRNFLTLDEKGNQVGIAYPNRKTAERAAKARGLSVQERTSIDILLPGEATQLPGGPDIRKGAFEEGQAPAGYEVKSDQAVLSTAKTEEEAEAKRQRLQAIRKNKADGIRGQIKSIDTNIAKSQQKLESMEADGKADTLEYRQLEAKIAANNANLEAQKQRLNAQAQTYETPLTITPKGVKPVTREGYTLFEKGKPKATFPTQQAAEEAAMVGLDTEQLQALVNLAPSQKGLMAKRLGKLARDELARRLGGEAPAGIKIKPAEGRTVKETEERLADLGIFTPKFKKQVDELEKKLRPMMDRLGLKDLRLNIVRAIQTPMGEADGSYAERLVTIALNADNPIRTLRHEAIHALKELGAFTNAQWKVLEKMAKEQWLGKYGIAERYKGLTQSEQIEEAIADAFSDFDQTKPPAGLVGALFNKIKKFFDALGNAMRGMGFQTAEDVFANVEKGIKLPEGEAVSGKEKFALNTEKKILNDGLERLKEAVRKYGEYRPDNPNGRIRAAFDKIYDGITGRLEGIGLGKREAGEKVFDLLSSANRIVIEEQAITEIVKPATERYSLAIPKAKVDKFFVDAEDIDMSEGVEIIRDNWIGGVAGIGDRDGAYDLPNVYGGKDYIKNVQDLVRKDLGNSFKGYRLMSKEEFEEIQSAAIGTQLASFTLDPMVGLRFSSLPMYANRPKGDLVVVEMDLTPEHIRMIGHLPEREVVVDYGEGYNPEAVIAYASPISPKPISAEKFQLKTKPEIVEPATKQEEKQAEKYFNENGILPYTQERIEDVPVETNKTKFSIKREGKYGNHDVLGLPVNKNGTVTLYFPTTNEGARETVRSKKLKPIEGSNRIYLTNESSGSKVMGEPGNIEQPMEGANVLIQIDPALLNIDQEYSDGRKDFFIPLSEGQAFINKMKQTKLFTLEAARDKGFNTENTLTIVGDAISNAVNEYSTMSAADRRARLKAVRDTLKSQHNIGTLLGENGKLEKTRVGDYGLTYEGQSVASLGLGLASAQRLNSQQRLTTCPQSAICEGLCLGETSGQNLLYGGVGEFRSGPRLSQYLKTEALMMHPEEFGFLLTHEIDSFRKWAKANNYQGAIRLNVTSDLPPKVFEGIINKFDDMMFYDYTKLASTTIAPNHHLTYSSTGASQIVDGKKIYNQYSNWDNMVKRLMNGQNVAMAFTSRNDMPDFVMDEKSGEIFQVWNGDNYDARFLDPKSEDGKGMVVGLTNKDKTSKPEQAAEKYNGFFLDYNKDRDGDTLVIKNQDDFKPGSKVTITRQPKYSLKAPDTKEFREWFGDSKIVNEDGTPKVMYHGTRYDIERFKYPITFVSPQTRVANKFAANDMWWSEGKPVDEGANVLPLYVRAENPFDYENPQHVKRVATKIRELAREGGLDPYRNPMIKELIADIPSGTWPAIEHPYVLDAITNLGFDAAYLSEFGAKNLAVFKRNQLKSAFAQQPTLASEDIRYSLKESIDPATAQAIDRTTTSRREEGFVERVLGAISPEARARFRQGIINKYEGIERLSKEKAKKFGDKELLADVSSIAAALFSDRAAGVAASSFRNGVPVYEKGYTNVSDLDGMVKGLIPILEPLMKYNDPYIFQMFQFYAATKRGKRLTAEGREKLFTADDIKRGQALETEYPEFKEVFNEYQKYNQGLVKYMKDTGVLSEKEAEIWTQNWDYIPFYRQMDGETTVGPRVFSAISGVVKPKKLKGGEEQLADFMETVVRNARAAIEAGMKNVAAQRVTRDVVALGLGREVPANQAVGTDIVTVKENGLTKYFQVDDPLLVESMKGLNLPQLPFLDILSKPAEVLRNLVTKDPGFMLANLMRDSLQAWTTTGQNMIPIVDTFKQYGAAMANMSPESRAFAQAGLFTGYDFAGDVKANAREVEKELRKRSGNRTVLEIAAWPVTKAWEALEKGSTASDMATRAEVYKRVLKETGNEAEALYQAMEVLNFSRRGNSALIRVLTAMVPFMNARIQGLDVLYRAGFGEMASVTREQQQKAFAVRSLYILGLSTLYWALASDTEEYKTAEQEVRDNYWIMGNVRIPIPFEIGTVFKVFPERILEYWFGQDTGKDLKESIYRNVSSTLAFNPIPQAVLPMFENIANYSFFTGQPIVSKGMEDVAPRFQATTGTSLLAKEIGEATNQSPIKIDNLIRGYTGTLGTYAVMMIDSIMRGEGDPTKATMKAEQLPVIKRFFASEKGTGTVSSYYDLKQQVEEATRTINYLERTAKPEDLKAYYEEKGAKLMAIKPLIQAMDMQMKDLRETRQAVLISKMDPDRKREVLDYIREAEVNMTSRIQMIKKQIS
jgi:hypothetical protein